MLYPTLAPTQNGKGIKWKWLISITKSMLLHILGNIWEHLGNIENIWEISVIIFGQCRKYFGKIWEMLGKYYLETMGNISEIRD